MENIDNFLEARGSLAQKLGVEQKQLFRKSSADITNIFINTKFPNPGEDRSEAFGLLDEMHNLLLETNIEQFLEELKNSSDPSEKEFFMNLSTEDNKIFLGEILNKSLDNKNLQQFEECSILFPKDDILSLLNNGHEKQSFVIEYLASGLGDKAAQLLELNRENIRIDLDQHDSTHYGNTALHICAAKGWIDKNSEGLELNHPYYEIAQTLINLGADPNSLNGLNVEKEFKYTALDLAVARRDLDMVEAICSSRLINENTVSRAAGYLESGYEACKSMIARTLIADDEHCLKDCTSLSEEHFNKDNEDQISSFLNQKLEIINPSNSIRGASIAKTEACCNVM